MADIIPIGLIILTYHIATMHRVAGWPLWLSIPSFVIYPALGYLTYIVPLDFMGSTKAYLPILPMLLVYFIMHKRVGATHGRYILYAFIAFAMSMTFRIFDYPLCDALPLGTHWIWHILNGLALYLAFKAYASYTCKIVKN